MRFLLLAAALTAALLSFPTDARSRTASVPTPAPLPAQRAADPATAPSGGTLMLSTHIDARGVDVQLATRKPALRFRQPRHAKRMPFRWTLRTDDGDAVATGYFDPGPLDLDPMRLGQQGEVAGDYLVPTWTGMNVKVPDVPFSQIEFAVRRHGEFQPFGVTRVGTFEVR